MRKIINLIIIFSVSIFITACSKDDEKFKNAQEAIANQNKIVEAKKNDTISPEITSSIKNVQLEVCDTVDYEHIFYSLKATDNIDGDISKNIEMVSSDIIEHEEGNYTITYSVKDSAGNKTEFAMPVSITSKYDQESKKRFNSCIKAYNKLSDSLKDPSSLNVSSIETNIDGSSVLIYYSAKNSFGARTKGSVVYDVKNMKLYDSSDIDTSDIHSDYVYKFEDIQEFSDYYHTK